MKAVIFDLDGVITDTAKYHFMAWQHLAKELGITLSEIVNEQLKGRSRMDSLEVILQHGGLAESLSTERKEQLAAKKNDYYKKMIASLTPEDILPGIRSLLEELQQNNIKIGLASASHNAPFILSLLGLEKAFDQLADPAQVTAGKPAPDIFLKAAELLNVNPCDCVGIEDAEAGVEAILAAKMTAIGVSDDLSLGEADECVADPSELNFALLQKVWLASHD